MAFELSSKNELYYRLDSNEILDEDLYEMLRHNTPRRILAPMLSQLDDDRTLCYETDSAITAEEYFANHVFDTQQLIALLQDATDAFIEGHEYMLNEHSFAGSVYYLYINKTEGCRLVYVPIIGYLGCVSAQSFLLDLFVNMRYDIATGDRECLTRINEALRLSEGFSPQRFKKLLSSLRVGRRSIEHSALEGSDQTNTPVDGMSTGMDVALGNVGSDTANGPEDGSPLLASAAGATSEAAHQAVMAAGASAALSDTALPEVDVSVKRRGLFRRHRKQDGNTEDNTQESRRTSKRRQGKRGKQKDEAGDISKSNQMDAVTASQATQQVGTQDEATQNKPSSETENRNNDARFASMAIPGPNAAASGMNVPSGGIPQETDNNKKDKKDKQKSKKKSRGLFGKKQASEGDGPEEEVSGNDDVHSEATEAIDTTEKLNRRKRKKRSRKQKKEQSAKGETETKKSTAEVVAANETTANQELSALNSSRSLIVYILVTLIFIALAAALVYFCMTLNLVEQLGFVALVVVIPPMLALSIYQSVFLYRLAKDVSIACAEEGSKPPRALLFILLPFIPFGFIYILYQHAKLAERMRAAAPRYGLSCNETGVIMVVLDTVGCLAVGLGPLMVMHILIKNSNALCGAYNASRGLD